MGPVSTFFAWFFAAIVLGAFGAPHEHGTGLFVFVVIVFVGVVGGLVHALIVYRRARRSQSQVNA